MRNEVVKIYVTCIDFNWKAPYVRGKVTGATGSGCFISPSGLILTASHVVVDSVKIYVEVPEKGGKKYVAKLVGCCPHFDLALIQVVGYRPKSYFRLGDSDKLQIGDETTAYGYPLGQTNLIATEGVVSGRKDALVQMDTPINPGNSGGPLIFKGKVVGVNVGAMVGNGISSTSYAVPINQYKLIARELKANQLVVRPFVGINVNNGSPDANQARGWKGEGVIVNKVFPGSPIDKTGIKVGDILLAINGFEVDNTGRISLTWLNSMYDLVDYFAILPLGRAVAIKFWNGKKTVNTKFTLTEYRLPISNAFPQREPVEYEVLAGLVVMNLATNHLKEFKGELFNYSFLNSRAHGAVLVTSVLSGSSADLTAVFQAGDRITEVNGKKVTNLEELRKAIRKSPGGRFSLKNQIDEEMVFTLTDLVSQNIILGETLGIGVSKFTSSLV